MLPRARSMLGKGQIYLPRDGFKRAHSWAEGVVSERVLEAESQQKKVEQLVLNLLFHPQLKQYIRSGIQKDYCIRKISLTPSWVSAHLSPSHHHVQCSAAVLCSPMLVKYFEWTINLTNLIVEYFAH